MLRRLSFIVGLLGVVGACDSGGGDAVAPKAKPDVKATPDAKAEPDAKAKPDAKAVPDAKAEPDAKAVPEAEAEAPPAGTGAIATVKTLEGGEVVLTGEGIGPLTQGMKPDEVVAAIGEPEKKAEVYFEEATGEHIQTWDYPTKGVSLDMWSESKKGPWAVSRLSAGPTCTLPLRWGLKIGSMRAEVEKVYGPHFDEHFTNDEQFVAGSIYDGVIYGFKDGKVDNVFIGAGAE